MNVLNIDVETYSSVDIAKCGAYKYVESDDFEILLLSYALNGGEVKLVDIYSGEEIPGEITDMILDDTTTIKGWNVVFERLCLNKHFGVELNISKFKCTMAKAALCALPLSLDKCSEVLKIENAKMKEGKDLIKLFSIPQKPTKKNPATRVYAEDEPEKWELYGTYNIFDVKAEMEIDALLDSFEIPEFEHDVYIEDQIINDTGVPVDIKLAQCAMELNDVFISSLKDRLSKEMSVENPKSAAQVKQWLFDKTGIEHKSLNKANIPEVIKTIKDADTLRIFNESRLLSKSSTAKYDAVLNYAMKDERVRGLFQYGGATRTARWAGRGVQLQNLRRNDTVSTLDTARALIKAKDADMIEMVYGDLTDTLSQLIRTVFTAPDGHTFFIADYSAIEARVLAWVANETWRLEVFSTHGKIYEATAALMFDVPIDSVDSAMRLKGKVSELALGYGGGVKALEKMGGENIGLSAAYMTEMVRLWRKKSPNVVSTWYDYDKCALYAVRTRKECFSKHLGIRFAYENKCLTIQLPSGRKLVYIDAHLGENKFGGECVKYKGLSDKKVWCDLDTYGGKLAENIVQAISRDILAYALVSLRAHGFPTCMHIHDEAVAAIKDLPTKNEMDAELERMCDVMSILPEWAKDLPIGAAGFYTKYYMKD